MVVLLTMLLGSIPKKNKDPSCLLLVATPDLKVCHGVPAM